MILRRNGKNAFIYPPQYGWKENTWYRVKVSVGVNNPMFNALLFTGFLQEKGQPGNYHTIVPEHTPEDAFDFSRVFVLEFKKELFQCEMRNKIEMPYEVIDRRGDAHTGGWEDGADSI